MEEKWNIFTLANTIYFARSWTGFCIYRVFISKEDKTVNLLRFDVNRNRKQYRYTNIEDDTILIKRLLQSALKREDFYSDPELELPIVAKLVNEVDPNNECIKSIGHNSAGLTRSLHNGNYPKGYSFMGDKELLDTIIGKPDNEPLLSLFFQNRITKWSTTYYFDQNATELLGQITVNRKIN